MEDIMPKGAASGMDFLKLEENPHFPCYSLQGRLILRLHMAGEACPSNTLVYRHHFVPSTEVDVQLAQAPVCFICKMGGLSGSAAQRSHSLPAEGDLSAPGTRRFLLPCLWS